MFRVQPGPGPIISPAGSQILLDCSVTEGFVVTWRLEYAARSNMLIDADSPAIVNSLRDQFGVAITNFRMKTSNITFSGRLQGSPIAVTCLAQNATNVLRRIASERVEIIIYGENYPRYCYDCKLLMHNIHRSSTTSH